MTSGKWADTVKHDLGGEHSQDKPKKEVSHVEVRKSDTKGDHIITHHHTHPEHHPKEEHTTRGDDEMVQHMMANMGTPNPGEADADAGTPDAASAAPTGTPAPAGGGAAAAAMPMATGA